MTNIKKEKDNFIGEEARRDYEKKIISFFLDERNEEIGIIAAGKLLDFFIENMGKEIYGRGVKDARKIIEEKMEDLEVDLDIISGK